MQYRVMNADGKHVGGHNELDDVLKASALLKNGWIVDENDVIVYESPGRLQALEEAEAAKSAEAEEATGAE